MFKDYYRILEISFNASDEEIKSAYKKQALRWHPDRNSDQDALIKMQDINEAYLILKDIEAKKRYDKEYEIYKKYQEASVKSASKESNTHSYSEEPSVHQYEFHDDILKRWMDNARRQASVLASQTLAEFRVGGKAAGKEMFDSFVSYALIGIIFSLIFIISRGCN